MSTRVLVVLAMILVIVVGAGVTFWMAAQPEGKGTAVPAAQVPDVEQRNHRERFFGGDPERSVRGGQEMKPRW